MAKQTIINTIRHAQTGYNAEKRYAGSVDVSLNEKGILDSSQAAARLDGIKFDVIISSTLRRSIETARIIAGDQGTIVQSKLCVERNFGAFEGRTYQEVQNFQPPVLWIEVGDDTHSVNPPGSEPFEQVWQRAARFRNWLFREYAGCNILVVSHGTFLQMFHGLLRGLSCIESLGSYPSNLELTTFRYHGRHLVDHQIVRLDGVNGLNF